ncbi:MAG: hypothetical protein ACFCBW_13775 [Candidatus Competibacterales bacterium]
MTIELNTNTTFDSNITHQTQARALNSGMGDSFAVALSSPMASAFSPIGLDNLFTDSVRGMIQNILDNLSPIPQFPGSGNASDRVPVGADPSVIQNNFHNKH